MGAVVVGVDLGGMLGLAIGSGGRAPPEVETVPLPGDEGQMALRIVGKLRSFFREHTVSAIAYEKPFPALSEKWRKSGQAQLDEHLTKQYGQKVLVHMVAEEYGLQAVGIPVNTARKLVVGNGYPKEDEIMAAVRRRGVAALTNHDADAAVIYFASLKMGGANGVE